MGGDMDAVYANDPKGVFFYYYYWLICNLGPTISPKDDTVNTKKETGEGVYRLHQGFPLF